MQRGRDAGFLKHVYEPFVWLESHASGLRRRSGGHVGGQPGVGLRVTAISWQV